LLQSEKWLREKSLLSAVTPQPGIQFDDTAFSPPQQPYTHLCLGFGVSCLGFEVWGLGIGVLCFGFGVAPAPFVREHALVAGSIAHGAASAGSPTPGGRPKEEAVGAQPRHQPVTVCVPPVLGFRF